MKFFLRYFNAKMGTEDIFKPKLWTRVYIKFLMIIKIDVTDEISYLGITIESSEMSWNEKVERRICIQ